MKSGPILVVAPLLPLLDQGAAYALVEWTCQKGHHALPLAVHGLFFAAAIVMLLLARGELKMIPAPEPSDAAAGRPHFVGWMAVAASALSALVIVAMTIPHGALSPCLA